MKSPECNSVILSSGMEVWRRRSSNDGRNDGAIVFVEGGGEVEGVIGPVPAGEEAMFSAAVEEGVERCEGLLLWLHLLLELGNNLQDWGGLRDADGERREDDGRVLFDEGDNVVFLLWPMMIAVEEEDAAAEKDGENEKLRLPPGPPPGNLSCGYMIMEVGDGIFEFGFTVKELLAEGLVGEIDEIFQIRTLVRRRFGSHQGHNRFAVLQQSESESIFLGRNERRANHSGLFILGDQLRIDRRLPKMVDRHRRQARKHRWTRRVLPFHRHLGLRVQRRMLRHRSHGTRPPGFLLLPKPTMLQDIGLRHHSNAKLADF